MWINEDVSRVHIFEVQTIADIIHTVPVTVVTEAFCIYHLVNLCLGSKSLAIDIWLRKDDTKKYL